ncbi:MAG: hypothetical protein ACLUTU_13920 [Blautia faecis]
MYREGGDKRNHSVSGYDYLKEEADIKKRKFWIVLNIIMHCY